MSAVSEYAELLKLIEVSGPFISLPIFKEVFPQGFAKDSPEQTRELRELYDDWREARLHAQSVVSPAQREWLRAIFQTLLGWPAEWLVEDNAIPQNLTHLVAQHHVTLRPDAVLLEDGKPRLLLTFITPAQQPDRRPPGATWNASHTARMAELLHATRVPLGLVTNGERFTLVYAEPEQPTGFADFRAELWLDERLTLRAFRDFLSADALFNRPPEQTLDALYRRSLENQQEVSTTLGRQVRQAVEMFVAALDRADREAERSLLQDVPDEQVYEAALTLMMRLVFLFFAEERDLLPVTNPIYQENYAVTTLHDQLRESANRLGEEVLERRYDAFPRLLAAFRAVHGGVEHDLAALPAYGGDLFDPDRFAFLEGRRPGSEWRTTAAQPFPIHNRTVLHLLGALQFLEMKVPGGGRETRRLSFRSLDIEQIGHVYEGLLDHTARRATEIVLGLDGKEAPEVALSELNRRREQSDFVDWLADVTGRSERTIARALEQTTVSDPLRWPEWDQVAVYSGLVRRDDNGDPCVIPAGSLYVTAGATRRQTGTQYTPRTLTESVVEHALAPLVYVGPAEGRPLEGWELKTAGQILDLKVCDFACGSAAFLVAAARYLSARLVEAWEVAQRQHGIDVQITPYGHPSNGQPEEELIPSNQDERGLFALRIAVERCLYGVDRNPLAVEMAKLSLWLLTLQRNRPFTFLDHAIRCGDSLLGVSLKQLSTWSLSGEGKQSVLFNDDLSFAADKREGLMKMQYRPSDQRRLLDVALAKTRRLRAVADMLIATAFEANSEAGAAAVAMGLDEQEVKAQQILAGKVPFHWPVEFPEVFLHGNGFDAIIGNPPFVGGSKITGYFGGNYREYLVKCIAGERRGNADYVVYFFLRGFQLLKAAGTMGLVATNTVAQGDSREVGLEFLETLDASIYRAVSSRPWPGEASLEVAHVFLRKGPWHGDIVLDDKSVEHTTSWLTASTTNALGKPCKLPSNAKRAFNGSKISGMGFVLSPEDAGRMIDANPKNAEVLSPFLSGEDLNSRWDQSPSRWVINFRGWSIEEARDYPDCFEIVERLVKPERDLNNRESRRRYWWRFGEWAPDLNSRIANRDRVLAIAETTKFCAFAQCPTNLVFSHMTKVIISDLWAEFAVLSSSIHEAWARQYSSTLENRLKYSPSDCFDTFPFPETLATLESIGARYQSFRQDVMKERQEGLTATYNRFHSVQEVSRDLAQLRTIQVEVDNLVAAAYGWDDLTLDHGFRETKQGLRFAMSEAVRHEVLGRLLELNHRHHAKGQLPIVAQPKPKRKPRISNPAQPELF